MKNEENLKQYCVPIIIEERGLAFWDYEILEKNLNFINLIDPEYFEYVAKSNFAVLEDEVSNEKSKQYAAINLRSAYFQGLEVLFSLLFATIQAPDCVIGWILKYTNTNLSEVIKKFVNGDDITTQYIEPIENWMNVSSLIFSFPKDEQSQVPRSKIENFAKLWSKFAKDFLETKNEDEYKGFKHGFRIKVGGHHFLFGPHEHTEASAHNQQWRTISNSKFGTTFYTAEKIGETPNFIILEHRLNWNPEKYFHSLLLVSTSIKNILVCLNKLNGNQSETDYVFPSAENFHEIPWEFNESASLKIRPAIIKANLPLLTKDDILSAYKKDVDSN